MQSARNLFSTLFNRGSINAGKLDNLFLLIKDNDYIPSFLAAVDGNAKHEKKVDALLTAIQLGDARAEIFDDANCYLYLLKLIQKDRIPFEQGMTIYHYLMGLLQFTDRQQLNKRDEPFKMVRGFTVLNMSDKFGFTADGFKYLENVASDLELHTHQNYLHDLTTMVLQLPPAERWLMKIDFGLDVDDIQTLDRDFLLKTKGFDTMIYQLMNVRGDFRPAPFFQLHPDENQKLSLLFPSMSIIRFCLNKVTDYPVEPEHLFGETPKPILRAKHRNNQHPLLLHAPDLGCNANTADDYSCGALGQLLHDCCHLFWASTMNINFRNKLYQFYIPLLENLQKVALEHQDLVTANTITAVIDTWDDFDLLGMQPGLEPEQRQFRYLEHGVSNGGRGGCWGDPIGSRKYDALLYLVESSYLHYGDDLTLLVKALKQVVDAHRHPVSHALSTLANHSGLKLDSVFGMDNKINWDAWLVLLRETKDPDELWKIIQSHHHRDLMNLINEHKFRYFPPYLPLTETLREELIAYMEELKNQRHANIRFGM